MSEVISIVVPEQLLERLNRQAEAARRPVEEMVVAALADSIPTPPKHLPDDIRKELSVLETLSDDALRQMAASVMNSDEGPAYTPGDASDLLMLRKAYALVLLKWRGHALQTVDVPHP
jgi:predicted transcriptional regulator